MWIRDGRAHVHHKAWNALKSWLHPFLSFWISQGLGGVRPCHGHVGEAAHSKPVGDVIGVKVLKELDPNADSVDSDSGEKY